MEVDQDMMETWDSGTESEGDIVLGQMTNSYEHLKRGLESQSKPTIVAALKQLRNMSAEKEGTIDHTKGMDIAARLAPETVKLLHAEDEEVLENASWVLVNISAGNLDQARTIISAEAIPLMVSKLKNRVDWQGGPLETALNIVWCFMNLATDREEFGKILVAHGVIDVLISMVEIVPASHLLLTSIAALSALEAEISWDLTCKRLPDVLRYVQWPNDKDELDDACRSLDYMLKRYNRQQLSIPDSVMSKVPYLIRHLTHSYRHVQRSSRGVLNTIASGSDEESQDLLDAGILNVLNRFLDESKKCAQACTTLSKLTAGNSYQIATIMETGIMIKLVNIITNLNGDLATWREAAWAVANALDGRRTPEQFRSLVLGGALEPMCKMLATHSHCFEARGDEGHLKFETTIRLLRCLDQATIHLPEIQGPEIVPTLIAGIEEIFACKAYHTYRRDSKSGITSPDPGSRFEQDLTLAMKRFSLDDDPEDALTKKMNTVKIKEGENGVTRSPFFHQFH